METWIIWNPHWDVKEIKDIEILLINDKQDVGKSRKRIKEILGMFFIKNVCCQDGIQEY